jgi:RHS repeat-associated protein
VSTAQQLAGGTSSGALLWAADPPQLSIDSNGNLTSKTEGNDTWTYEWDAENQLKRVLKNGVEQARFAYDPLGRRVEKVAEATTIAYLWDDDSVLREQTNSGASTFYIHSEPVDEPVAKETTTGVRTYYHLDGLSSVAKVTDSAGAVLSGYSYDPFGRIQTGSTVPGFAFTGREWEPDTGLYYYRARYYDAISGRFLSEDPARDGPNPYVYVGNSPATYTDPYGLVKMKGFPPDKQQQVDAAIDEVRKKLAEEPCCAGKWKDKILNAMEKAKYIYKPSVKESDSTDCGWSVFPPRPFPVFLMRRIYIPDNAFDPRRCDKLACTIIHEATHIGLRTGDQGPPWGMEQRCFGCRISGTPKFPN